MDKTDIGKTNRKRSPAGRKQQPTKERGTAGLSPKEAQRKAYRERKARESGAKTQSASDLLRKKDKPKAAHPAYKPHKAQYKGLSGRTARQKLQRTGDRIIKDIRKGEDKPASAYK